MRHLCLTLDRRSPAAAIDAMFAGAKTWPRWWRRPARIWLSGALARPFCFGPVSGLNGWREAHDAAAAMAPMVCGLAGPCSVELEANPSREVVLASAVDQALLDGLYAGAEKAGVRVVSIKPMWAAATGTCSNAGERVQLLWCRDADSVTFIATRGRAPAFAATYAPIPDEPQTLLRRLCAANGATESELRCARIHSGKSAGKPRIDWQSIRDQG